MTDLYGFVLGFSELEIIWFVYGIGFVVVTLIVLAKRMHKHEPLVWLGLCLFWPMLIAKWVLDWYFNDIDLYSPDYEDWFNEEDE